MKLFDLLILLALAPSDDSAQEEFWRKSASYRQRLYYLALGYLQNPDEAEDMVHEALEKGAKNYGRFEGRAGLYTWLVRILINGCKDFHKKNSRKKERRFEPENGETPGISLSQVTDHTQNFAKKIELSEAQECLINIINAMDSGYKATVFLRYFEDLKYSEIAQTLQISEGTVKSRLNEARRLIRVQMEQSGFGGDSFGL